MNASESSEGFLDRAGYRAGSYDITFSLHKGFCLVRHKTRTSNIGCWPKNFVYVVAADLFILYVHEHDRLGFGMLTVETAVLNPRAIFDCICGFSSSCDRKGQ